MEEYMNQVKNICSQTLNNDKWVQLSRLVYLHKHSEIERFISKDLDLWTYQLYACMYKNSKEVVFQFLPVLVFFYGIRFFIPRQFVILSENISYVHWLFIRIFFHSYFSY